VALDRNSSGKPAGDRGADYFATRWLTDHIIGADHCQRQGAFNSA
jgi:hypothetical protein